MDSTLRTPEWACPAALLEGTGARPAPSLVICDPASLCAEAIGAVVQKRTNWRVACVTTSMDVALVAVEACKARALLFDVRDCSPRAVSGLVHRLRSVSPQTAPVFLTGHTGARALRSAIAAGVSGCVHKSDPASALAEALHAVEEGGMYQSETVVRTLATLESRASHTALPLLAGKVAPARQRLGISGHARAL